MDLSIKLKLDDSGLAGQAQAAAGQIFAAAQTAASVTGGASKSADDLAAAAKQVAATARDAASALKQQADALAKTAGATKEAAGASKEKAAADKQQKEATKELSGAIGQARGAMGVFGGATAMASGSLEGMVGGAMSATNGLKALGATLQTAVVATGVLAVAAAVAMLAKHLLEAGAAAAALQSQADFSAMEDGASRSAGAFSKLCSEMERAAGLQRDLDDVAGSGRRLEQEKQLAQLELERNEVLAAGGDADGINKSFDAKKRALEFSFRRGENADALAGIQRDRDANAARRGEIEKELQRLTGVRREQWAKQSEFETLSANSHWRPNIEKYDAEAARWGGAANETNRTMEALLEEAKNLEAADKVLAERQEVERGRGEVIDIEERAANLAAQLPEKKKDDAGGFGSLQTASDRLARIGGFVGGNYSRQNEAREQVQLHRQELEVLKSIDRKTKDREGAVLA